MAASVLGKRQRGALHSEGTLEAPQLFPSSPRSTNRLPSSTCITRPHF